ncbi:uncharacterized protein LOC144452767 [Glandiceps talaboti]
MNESLTTINIDQLTNAVSSVHNAVPSQAPPPIAVTAQRHHGKTDTVSTQHQIPTPGIPVSIPVSIPTIPGTVSTIGGSLPTIPGTVSTIGGSVPLMVPVNVSDRAILNLTGAERNFPVIPDSRGFQPLDPNTLRHLGNIALPFTPDRNQAFAIPVSSVNVSVDNNTVSSTSGSTVQQQPILVNTSPMTSIPLPYSHVPVTVPHQPSTVEHNTRTSERSRTSQQASSQPISINVNINMPNVSSAPLQVPTTIPPSPLTVQTTEGPHTPHQQTNRTIPSTPATDASTMSVTSDNQNEEGGQVVILTVSKETETEDEIIESFVTDLWCVDCNQSHPADCPNHGPVNVIYDTPIESKARMSVPKQLRLKPSKISNHTTVTGVWTHEAIPNRTMFGPLQGKIVKKADDNSEINLPMGWEIFRDGKLHHHLDGRDENEANWMVFVKKARRHTEQNLVAFQYGNSIYFTTNRPIEPKTELLVWYCKDYAKLIGVTEKPEESYKCSQCEKQFADLSQLARHMKYSHPDMSSRKWKCHLCSRAFTSSAKLNVHVLVHMGVKPHKCEHCDKTFTDPSNLRMHLSIHTGLKRFHCNICEKTFRQKAHLHSHMVTHTGEKKLKCQFCDRMFSRHSDVKQHTYMHTKEKQVQCQVCGRIFWRLQHLKKHMKTHTGERDFKCEKCEKAFQTRYHLKRHSEICKGPRETKPVRTPRIGTRTSTVTASSLQFPQPMQAQADSSMGPNVSGEYSLDRPRRTSRQRRPVTYDNHETDSPLAPVQPTGLTTTTQLQPQMGVVHPAVPSSSQTLPNSDQVINNEICDASASQEHDSVTSSIEE